MLWQKDFVGGRAASGAWHTHWLAQTHLGREARSGKEAKGVTVLLCAPSGLGRVVGRGDRGRRRALWVEGPAGVECAATASRLRRSN